MFYIPGYDPIHPRRYRELYRKEGADQAAISGYEIGLTARAIPGPYGWHVSARFGDAAVETDVDVLVWSDIVRASMSRTIGATYLQLVRTVRTYVGSGALRRLMRLRKGPVIAALYPVGMLVLQALIAVGLGCAVVGLALWLAADAIPGIAAGAVPGAVVAGVVLRWFKARDNRFFAHYLMHDYAYSAQLGGANPPELEARIAEFTGIVAAAMREEVDEVLVVGHSSGAHLAVSILADLIRQGGVPAHGPALGFLSLGQVVPMVSFLPRATRLRADLHFLSARPELTWIDVTAPGDGCAFALCDPVSVSGVAPEGKRWPLVFSAQFTRSLSPARWKALRWKFFRLHFQYLCAFDRPLDYDYFRITAGPVSLARRYAGRPPSASRIETPASAHVTMAA